MGCCVSRVKPLKQKEHFVEKSEESESGKGICQECGRTNSFGDDWSTWCISCNGKHFKNKFSSWTSGNKDIDRLIRNTQLTANHYEAVIEFIPYHQFKDIEYITKGGFGTVSKAKWNNGPILRWDREKKDWFRWPHAPVALKTLCNSQRISSSFLDEITKHLRLYKCPDTCSEIVRCHGISQDPVSKEYIMVFEYCSRGDLAQYIDSNFQNLTWPTRLDHLLDIARGLNTIHSAGLLHGDFHCGNLLIDVTYAAIGDLGLCHPADKPLTKNRYGVLPYIAPEVLRSKPYTKKADIYSFGVIMWELSSGRRPFYNIPHDLQLQLQICYGFRPEIIDGVPECYKELMQKCWHNDPEERPNTSTIIQTIEKWVGNISENDDSVWHISDKNRTVEESSENKTYSTHSQAVYTSRLIISYDSLEEMRIRISQLHK